MVCFAAFACRTEPDIPDDIIAEDKMANILVDIHLLEAKIDALGIPIDSSQRLYKAYEYDLLTNKYQVDTVTYKKSFSFYRKHLKEFARVYDQVQRSTEEKQKDGF